MTPVWWRHQAITATERTSLCSRLCTERDGRAISSYEWTEALEHLPAGVESVMLRSDTAGYQQELLRYCAEGRFGVRVRHVKPSLSEVAEDWQTLPQGWGMDTGQQSEVRTQLDRPLQKQP